MRFSVTIIYLLFISAICGHAQNQEIGRAGGVGVPGNGGAGLSITSDDSYKIGTSDMLTITVWKEPTLSGELLVRPDGMISMPLLGDIPAAGMKPMQLASQIAAGLKRFMRDPDVSVVVAKIHDNFIYLLGEVGKKGPVVMPPHMSLLEAISSGGGLTDFANKKKIYILRSADGKQKKIPVNYKKALRGDAAFNIALKPGDTIVVP